jgi:hypothetical protein
LGEVLVLANGDFVRFDSKNKNKKELHVYTLFEGKEKRDN